MRHNAETVDIEPVVHRYARDKQHVMPVREQEGAEEELLRAGCRYTSVRRDGGRKSPAWGGEGSVLRIVEGVGEK